MFTKATSANTFSDFLNYKIYRSRVAKDYEIGFTFLVYLVSKIFNNIHIVMFVIEALIIFPIYFGLKKIKCMNNKIGLGMLIYYFLFFHPGLNLMRQYVGVSFAFYGICCILAKENKCIIKYIISSIIAFTFHKSTIMSAILVIIYYILYKKNKKERYLTFNSYKIPINTLLSLLILFVGLFALLNLGMFNSLLKSVDGMSRYTMYTKSISISDFSLVRVFPIIIIFLLLFKKFINKNENSLFYILTFCMAYLVFGQLSNVSKNGVRISILFTVFNVITYPLLASTPNTKKGKILATSFIVIYVIAYWGYMYVYRGFNQTVPFVLGI